MGVWSPSIFLIRSITFTSKSNILLVYVHTFYHFLFLYLSVFPSFLVHSLFFSFLFIFSTNVESRPHHVMAERPQKKLRQISFLRWQKLSKRLFATSSAVDGPRGGRCSSWSRGRCLIRPRPNWNESRIVPKSETTETEIWIQDDPIFKTSKGKYQ